MRDIQDHLSDLFVRLGEVRVRKMFGGYGVYHEGLMFALIADDIVYLKADFTNRHFFEELALAQFTYDKKGKAVSMSYYRAPDEIFDDPHEAAIWGRRSFEAALRARSGGG